MPASTENQEPVSTKKTGLMAYLLLAVAYVAAGELGLMLALPPGYASPVFPPAGIAIAAAFIGGKKTLPWIFLGSLVLNVWVGYTASLRFNALGLGTAAIIAAASMLQAALGGWLLRRAIGHRSLTSMRDFLPFVWLAPIACVTSATLSVGGLWEVGVISGAEVAAHWAAWWLGDTLGVVVMFPLVLALIAGPRTERFIRARTTALPVLLVLITGFLAVYFLQQAAINTARHIQRDEFDYQVRDIVLRIEQRLASYEQVMRGVRGLYRASLSVERNEFHDYVSAMHVETRYPGIQGIGYSLIIRPQEMARHIASIRKEGFPGYTPHPPSQREFSTSIIYIEPFSGRNLRAFGYDMYSEPVRRAAMEAARDMNESIMSGKVTLVQETEEETQPGFLMYLPVYRNGKPHVTIAERRANILGWVYAPFRMNDLMHGILGEQIHNIDLEIYDGASANAAALMYDSQSRHPRTSLLRHTTQIATMGRVWTITLRSLPAFEANMDTGRITVIRVSGLLITLLLSLVVWQLASGRARALELAQEITRELRNSEKQLKDAQRVAHLGSWELEIAGKHMTWSDEAYRILEADPASFGTSYGAFLNTVHPEDRDLVDIALEVSLTNHTPYSIEHRLLMQDGRVKHVREAGETLYGENGQPLRTLGTIQDITEQKVTQERIERMARYDTLTNLPNRSLFYDRLRHAISVARRDKTGLTLLYMDLDGFKQVNDTMGHHAGDLLLIGVAQRLTECIRESDTVSRLGGDEFTVVLAGMHMQEEVLAVAQKIIHAISAPFDLEGRIANIGISIGVARYTEEADNEDDLVRRADEAMYAAKMAGKNTYRIASVP